MNKEQLINLIRESRALIKTATPEQKIRLLKLIRESYLKIKNNESQVLVESIDYLEEK